MEKILFLKKAKLSFHCDVKSFSEDKVQFVISQNMYNSIENALINIKANVLELPSGKVSVIIRKENSEFEFDKSVSTYKKVLDAIDLLNYIVHDNDILFDNPHICTTEKRAADNIEKALSALKIAKLALKDLGYK